MTSIRNILQTGVCLFALAGPAFAQADTAGRDVIVVTAQLRSESVQEVPISLEVVTDDDRIKRNVNSLFDLQETVPSLSIGIGGASNTISMRGIGSGGNSSFDQSVGTFIDGVYHGRSRLSSGTFLDLERIEVLKGPQTTYFGNNAIAGALSIVTAGPSDVMEGRVRALYGQHGQYAVEAGIGGPLNDTLGFRIAVGVNGTDGWIENVNTGEDGPDRDNQVGRITLAFEPDDNFDVKVKFEASRNRDKTGALLQIDDCPPSAPYAVDGFCGLALLLGAPGEADDRQVSTNAGEHINLDTIDGVITANYRFADHTLTSVTGYYDYEYDFNFDADGLPLPIIHVKPDETYDQISQELRLSSPTGQTLEYIVGGYYHKGSLDAPTETSLFFLSPDLAMAVPPLAPFLPIGQSVQFAQKERNLSAFGALTWNITDQLNVTGAVRYTNVKKDFVWNLFYATANGDYGDFTPLPEPLAAIPGALGLGIPGEISGSQTDDAWMPSGKIQYHANDDVMLYASYTRGFKAGGFNSGYSAPTGLFIDEISYDPEYVDAYELGMKSVWFDGAVLLNLALFRSEYDDLQLSNNMESNGAFVTLVQNAASSVSQGVEVEASWDVTPDFNISGAMTYLDAYFVDYQNVELTPGQAVIYNNCLMMNPGDLDACASLQFQDLSGSPTDRAPEWSGNIGGEYTFHLPNDFAVTTNLTAFLSSSYTFGLSDRELAQDSYARLDGRVTIDFPGDRLSLDLIVQNITDEQILTYSTYYPTSPGSRYVQYQQPRHFMGQLRYSW